MLFEIRNYHFNPDLFEAIKEWGKAEAAPYLSQHLDVLGSWASTKDEPLLYGEPLDKLGSANFTRIIRWRDLAHRNTIWPRVWSSPELHDILSRMPGGMASFLRVEAKFAESIM